MSINYQILYEQEKQAFQAELAEYKERSSEIEELLEKEIADMAQALQKKNEDLQITKDIFNIFKDQTCLEMEKQSRVIVGLEQKCTKLQEQSQKERLKLVSLENENDFLLSQNRALEAVNTELENKVDRALEQLALLQTELEDNRLIHQKDIETIEKLEQQIRDTESESQAQEVKDGHKLTQELQQQQQTQLKQHRSDSRETSSTLSYSRQISPTTKLQQCKRLKTTNDCFDLSSPSKKQSTFTSCIEKENNRSIWSACNQFEAKSDESIKMLRQNSPNHLCQVIHLRGRQQQLIRDDSTRHMKKYTKHRYLENRNQKMIQLQQSHDKLDICKSNLSRLKLTQLGFTKSIDQIIKLINHLNTNTAQFKIKKTLQSNSNELLQQQPTS